ncbi:hypothetical protein B0H19DRAFT_1155828 [Mycena capillaripes]|nr:hypothetical protein B0H19DRAFT_1155828 [Mycena capillaripes]
MAATACIIWAALTAVQIHPAWVQAEHSGALVAYRERLAAGLHRAFTSAGARSHRVGAFSSAGGGRENSGGVCITSGLHRKYHVGAAQLQSQMQRSGGVVRQQWRRMSSVGSHPASPCRYRARRGMPRYRADAPRRCCCCGGFDRLNVPCTGPLIMGAWSRCCAAVAAVTRS